VGEDRSDVLFDLSAAEDRRLLTPGNCAGPIRCLSDVDGLFQPTTTSCGLRASRHVLVSPANSVIETPETASIIIARSAPRSKSLERGWLTRRLASVKLLLLPVMRDGTFRQNGSHPIGDGRSEKLYCPTHQSMEKRKKNLGMKVREGIKTKHFWVGIRHLQGIGRGMPRTARQSGGLQQTKHDGDKKATCKKSYQSMRRRDFNIISLRHKRTVTSENEGKRRYQCMAHYTDPVSAA